MQNCKMVEWETERECGRPAYTNASDLCEKHYADQYKASYDRIKPEVKCPECNGLPTRQTCPICFDRGWVNPNETVKAAPTEDKPDEF